MEGKGKMYDNAEQKINCTVGNDIHIILQPKLTIILLFMRGVCLRGSILFGRLSVSSF